MAQPSKAPASKPTRTAFLAEVKQRLVREYDRLTSRLSALVDKGKTLWQEQGDKEDENASEVAEFQDTISLEKNLEKSRTELSEALKQVEAGTYGTCQQCKNPIEEARLKLVPGATLCATCVKRSRES